MFMSQKWQSSQYTPLLSQQVLSSEVVADGFDEKIADSMKSIKLSIGDLLAKNDEIVREKINVRHLEKVEKNGKPVLILENVLLKEECKLLIELSEKLGYEDADSYCYAYNDRFNDRLMVDDDALTQVIWNRVKDHLPQELNHHGMDMTLHSLNNRWRLCKYKPGHYFGTHTDGTYSNRSNRTKSALTFMIYLNSQLEGDFKGGSTIFFEQYHRKETARVIERSGTCIVFPQEDMDMLHCGEKVTDGVKYILRTDTMFKIKQSSHH
ncbi:predicted protein [Naegleria gruberi]|uniref:Predicted protein n=1 Tax=Naegleria gruberi TaxID=5762 RepID=D2VRB4_NAEGR|nr:uncharacterized protein NAEGRDRAFT_71526 [Naegleria gruberi]EFC40640.1 predicted protein [Naegleria gruberi]|eukprot:XP_002673384.1 predicted protein [Naegleria gruberi strain NEG-M]